MSPGSVCFFFLSSPPVLPISGAFLGEFFVEGTSDSEPDCVGTCSCGAGSLTRATKPKLRAAPRSPPHPPRGRAEIEFIIQEEQVPAVGGETR